MQQFRAIAVFLIPIVFCALYAASITSARADARRFTYIYEATTEEPGEVESENWITWATSVASMRWIFGMRSNSA